jgi:hypothetical protein
MEQLENKVRFSSILIIHFNFHQLLFTLLWKINLEAIFRGKS